MSILKSLKSVPGGLKLRECERTKLHEPPPVAYIPTKDEVQEEVSRLRNLEIKTMIKKDTNSQLSGVARKEDTGSLSYACDGSTRCDQETWSFL
jgi:hypothetical protein